MEGGLIHGGEGGGIKFSHFVYLMQDFKPRPEGSQLLHPRPSPSATTLTPHGNRFEFASYALSNDDVGHHDRAPSSS
jgi:hypothetical protein